MINFVFGMATSLAAILILYLALTKKGYFKISFLFKDPVLEGEIFTLDLFQEKLLLVLKEDFPEEWDDMPHEDLHILYPLRKEYNLPDRPFTCTREIDSERGHIDI